MSGSLIRALVDCGLAYTALGVRHLWRGVQAVSNANDFGINDTSLNPPEGRLELGTLRGYRAWALQSEAPDGHITLRGITYRNEVWTEGVNRSVHRASTLGDGIVENCPWPVLKCQHGYYAYYSIRYWQPIVTLPTSGYQAAENTTDDFKLLPADPCGGAMKSFRIFGVVDAFGHVVRGTKGFKAEKAVIMGLALPIIYGKKFVVGDLEEYFIDMLHESYPTVPIYPSPEALFAELPLYDHDLDVDGFEEEEEW